MGYVLILLAFTFSDPQQATTLPTSPDHENMTSRSTTMNINLASIIAAMAIKVLLSIFGTLGNLLVLLVILTNFRLASASNLLLANLASVDLLCLAFVTPGGIYRTFCRELVLCHAPDAFVLVHRGIAQFVVAASASSLFAIAVDRFIAISLPFKYTTLMTRTRAFYCILLSWLISASVAFIFVCLQFFYVQSIYCILLILVTVSLYVHIFVFALKKERQIAALQVSNIRRGTNFLHERKSTKTMAIILGVFIAAWVPAVAFYATVPPHDQQFLNIQNWINVIYFLNAALNPFIYGVRSSHFRKRVRLLIKTTMTRFRL